MNDTQNETTTNDNEQQEDMENMVAEDRAGMAPRECRGRGGKVFLLLLLIVVGAGVAGWYYQSMWLPRAQQWLAGLWPAEEEPDPLAAPEVDRKYLGKSGTSSPYLLSAIPDTAAPTEAVPTEAPAAEAPVATETAEPGTPETVEDGDLVAKTELPSAGPVEAVEMEPATPPGMPEAPAEHEVKTDSETGSPMAAPVPDVTGPVTLQQARQAYWSRDLVAAESMYRQLLASDGTSADAWGELGNVYYLQAKWAQAAEAYTEAAIRLLQQGDYSQAMYLRYIVLGLDPRQVKRVDLELQRMQAPARG